MHKERNPFPAQLIAGGPRFDPLNNSKERRVLTHGEAWVGTFPDSDLWEKLANPSSPAWHFVGYIRYQDARGTMRRVGFCRRYDYSLRRFVLVDDPSFEYAD